MARVFVVAIVLAVVGCSDLEQHELGPSRSADSVFGYDLSARGPDGRRQATGSIGGGGAPSARIFTGGDDGRGGSVEPQGSGATAVGGGSYDLNFENTEVSEVTKVVLGDVLGVTYAIDPHIEGTMSLSSARPVAKKDVLSLFESALRINNAALIRDGQLYKVVPAGDNLSAGHVDRGRRVEPGYGLSVLPVKWVSVQSIAKTLEGMSSQPGSVQADTARNLLLVQGTGPQRRSLLETAMSLDVDFMKNQSVGIFPVSNSTPEAVVGELQNIFDASKEGGAQDTVRFQTMPRLGAILAVARNSASIERVRTWVARLDRSDYADGTLRIYRLKYGNAKAIAALLRDVFAAQGNDGGTTGSAAQSGLSPNSATRRTTSFGSSSDGASNAGSGSSTSGSSTGKSGGLFTRADIGLSTDAAGGSGSGGSGMGSAGSTLGALGEDRNATGAIRITADTVNNSVIVSAPREQFRQIERTIKEMDTAPTQVAIEATVAEVTLQNDLQYGVQFYLRDKSGSALGFTNGTSVVPSSTSPGFNAILGPGSSPRVVINALRSMTEVKVLSSPSLVVLNNQVASLEVGDQVPVTTRQVTSTDSSTAPTINSVDYRDTGVILRVQPRVSADGTVSLDVEQEVSNVVTTTSSSTAASNDTLTPTISQRRIRSSVSVASGQTIVLGGMIGARQEKVKSGLPFLGLFGRSLQNDVGGTNTEIIVFIRPQVVRGATDAQTVSEEFRNKLQIMQGDTPVARAPVVVKY